MNIFFKYFNKLVEVMEDLWLILQPNKLFISGFIFRDGLHLKHFNWGDDINVFFLEQLSGKKIVVKNNSYIFKYLPIKSYSCIGSVLGEYNDSRIEVWGSGIIREDLIVKHPPKKIHSVRGPLTRKILLEQGIKCPEKYGDPALLLCKYYNPKVERKYKIGIIPHYRDLVNPLLMDFYNRHKNEVIIIKMRDYKDWHDIPDLICSCKYILSSSLHGLIISDSYGVPNKWISMSSLKGGYFKFWDYYLSVGRKEETPTLIKEMSDFEELLTSENFEVSRNIDFSSILDSCPFNIKPNIY